MKRSILLALVLLVVATGCKKKSGGGSPTTPSNTPPATTPTRIITLLGSLAFGDVTLGDNKVLTFSIRNDGNSLLTVTGMTVSNALGSTIVGDWTNGTIAAGATQDVRIRFTPESVTTYDGTLTVVGDQTSGTNTMTITGRGTAPGGSFGPGQKRVGTDIQAGRYFNTPRAGDSCYWERLSGFGGTLGEIVANDFVGATTFQVIVDIAGSDVGFRSDVGCGSLWRNSPTLGGQSTIRPGSWLVGAQLAPGTYTATPTRSGCYWERRTDFSGELNGIIANDFISDTGQVFVTIGSGDVGFYGDADCGTWANTSPGSLSLALQSFSQQSKADIQRNRDLNRATRWP